MTSAEEIWILQLCHGYDGPFLDCARQYASLFDHEKCKVTTVYLTGAPDAAVERESASDEVIFLNYGSRDIRGLKLKAISKMRHLFRRKPYQFCIAHRFKPLYVALLASKLPVVGVNHAFGVYRRLMRQSFVRCFRDRIMLLGVSDAVRDDIRQCLPHWSECRIQTLYNRVDVAVLRNEQLPRQEARVALDLPPGAWVVGNVGRLHVDKDQATLIRGFARALPSLPAHSLLAIMGSGNLEVSLRELAHSLGIAERVRFLGQIPKGRQFFRAFDVFALSSDHEPFGMVLIEAMAAEVPVLCSDCGGGREIVAGAGRLFRFADPDDLARALQDIAVLSEADQRDICASQTRRLLDCFSDEAARPLFWQHMREFI